MSYHYYTGRHKRFPVRCLKPALCWKLRFTFHHSKVQHCLLWKVESYHIKRYKREKKSGGQRGQNLPLLVPCSSPRVLPLSVPLSPESHPQASYSRPLRMLNLGSLTSVYASHSQYSPRLPPPQEISRHFKKQCSQFRKLLAWLSLSTAKCNFSYIQFCSHKCETQIKIGSFQYQSTPASPMDVLNYNEYSCVAQHFFRTLINSVDYIMYASTALRFSSTIIWSGTGRNKEKYN